jgi:hypothetical protein
MSEASGKRGGGDGGDSRRKKARYMVRCAELSAIVKLNHVCRAVLAAARLFRTARRACWFRRTRAKTA